MIEQPITDLISERYLAYALSTIMSRSLPDVRDGLKPVHRRLLYAMAQLKLDPKHPPKKSARVVGDVIGKFHPHGDQSVYDALVRLAQDFAVRYPLVDGQGNFGNIDGDNAAAMRYTEARLTETAQRLLEGLDENAVDFRPTYDGDSEEPIVLAANFPNLLANGASGIAVGMACSIPPHNVAEICDGLLMLLENKKVTVKELVGCIKGPDFPTGGILVEPKESILQAYETGRGSFRVRAKWKKEELKGGGYQIVVTEIPYQVQKSKLIEKVAALMEEKKLPLLDDIIDESAEDVRVVLTPKSRNVAPELLMESLFRNTDFETRFSLNMNVLTEQGKVPRVLSLKDVLQEFLNHRQVVLVRQSKHRLEQVNHRLEVLAGYLIVFLNLDKVIKIIRDSDEPKPALMKAFKLTEVQTEAILNMRLRSLRKLEEMEIKQENKALTAEKDDLEKLISSEARQWTSIKKQVQIMQKAYGLDTELGKRRSTFSKAPDVSIAEALDEVLTEKEPITVVCSDKGWIRAMKGWDLNIEDFKYKEGDEERFVLEAMTTDKLLVFATNGRFYALSCDKLPSGRGFGEPLKVMMELPQEVEFVSISVYMPEEKLLVASDDGRGFIVPAAECLAQTKNGKQILNVDEGVKAVISYVVEPEHDHVAVIGENRKLVVFPLDQIPEMNKGKGITLQKYKDGGLADVKTFTLGEGLSYGSVKRQTTISKKELMPWLVERAQAGRLPPNGFPRSGKF
ncbi:MAG: DNA topoisomerase IV subunit A [Alphaproteobacteria bacterium]|nr:DNA topoisomerase IV subunit A [Alphaproteobacteria bacterium]